MKAGTRSFQTYEASGNGGQFLVVIPELEMVVVATAGNYGQYGVWRSIRELLVTQGDAGGPLIARVRGRA